jgi:mono/diheme cytochrome c family protein
MVSTPAGPRLVKTIPAMAMTEKFYPNTATDTERRLAMLKRGQERFNIFCSPCHGRLGDGNGMIAMRGLSLRRKPATYHSARMRRMPDGHFYNVITNGFGVMYPYASRIEPQDRWAIVAYIRALQLSQNATPADVPAGTNLDRPATGSEGGANSPGGEEAAR